MNAVKKYWTQMCLSYGKIEMLQICELREEMG